ncbi:hypothetical protein [Adhaeribacter pallidiroseus]|uniref:hypothetical protein n=1 Tax=Adhaeribacter pallidiroseus TaxID=2072847 RepID=UPI0011C0622D|nr:hypothetical protein [Adhaeribacter pallidiroseus]
MFKDLVTSNEQFVFMGRDVMEELSSQNLQADFATSCCHSEAHHSIIDLATTNNQQLITNN